MSDRKAVTARDVKRAAKYFINVPGVGLMKLRRADLPTLVLDGLIPLPLLGAVDNLSKMREIIATHEEPMTALSSMTKDDRESILELMRTVATVVVVEPRCVFPKYDADGRKMPVGDDVLDVTEDLSAGDLIVIWKGMLREQGIQILSPDEADRFHSIESAIPVDAVRNGDPVPSSTVDMDVPRRSRDSIASSDEPGRVEYLGRE